MKEEKILCGSESELIKHFCDIVSYTQTVMNHADNLLYSNEGIKKQMSDIVNNQKGIGMIFYMIVDTIDTTEPIHNINLSLMKSYIHVKSDTPYIHIESDIKT